MMVPWTAPMKVVEASPAATATNQGRLNGGAIRKAETTAPTPATKPTERSISPSSRTKISAMPRSTKTAPCTKRLVRLSADRNTWTCNWKMTTIATSPPRMGRTPLSPLRTRFTQARRYSPKVLAISSGEAASSASRAAAPETVSSAAGLSPSRGEGGVELGICACAIC